MRPSFVVATAVLIPSLAAAEPPRPLAACHRDVQTLCANVQPGGGRIRDCMRQHRTEISPACKIAIADRMLEHGGPPPRGMGPGGGRDVGGQGAVPTAPDAMDTPRAHGSLQHIQQSVLNRSPNIKRVPPSDN